MSTVNIHAAKTHLSRLVEEAEAGKEVIIAKAGVPMVRLGPIKAVEQKERPLGLGVGRLKIPPEVYEPLPDDILDLF